MNGRLLFIYHPNAGLGRIKNKLSEIVEILSRSGNDVVIFPTQKKFDAREKAKEYAENGLCDRIVCAGGDGTFNEIVSGVIQAGKVIPIAHIPSGTVNDLAYSLKIPKSLTRAAELAVSGELLMCDVGGIGGHYFTYSASFGVFSDVSFETPQNLKNALGRTAYILGGITKLANVKKHSLKVSYDDVVIEDDFIMGIFANSDSVGGFKDIMGKDVQLDDGMFEMLLIKMPHNVVELNTAVFDLLRGNIDSKSFYFARIGNARVTSDDAIVWAIDGEDGGDMRDATITVHKQAACYVHNVRM